jgi:hypothetical protein
MRMRIVAALLVAVAAAGCGPKIDLTKGLQVVDVSTGWADKGIVGGQNKLVPSITFSLKNVSDKNLNVLDVNAAFHQNGEAADWDSDLVNVAGSEGLDPNATTKKFTVDSKQGYKSTGEETRADMLKNSHFIDAHVDLFAKYGNTQWVKIGEFPITRELLPSTSTLIK